MQAIRQHAFGGPRELRLESVPDPHPADGQVRIRVESAGVHLLDTVIRQAKPVDRNPSPSGPVCKLVRGQGRCWDQAPGSAR
jgi:NADPH:quinone reductase-like Zn-dependent oxidoreductase